MANFLQNSATVFTRRRLGLATAAAFLGCAACCAMPLLAAAGLGGGGAALLSAVFRPGHELLVGGAAFITALGAAVMWSRIRRRGAPACGTSCRVDGKCGVRTEAGRTT